MSEYVYSKKIPVPEMLIELVKSGVLSSNPEVVEIIKELKDEEGEERFRNGSFRVTMKWVDPEGCECNGLQHHNDCPHWVMPY
jgi:hypothetical protein